MHSLALRCLVHLAAAAGITVALLSSGQTRPTGSEHDGAAQGEAAQAGAGQAEASRAARIRAALAATMAAPDSLVVLERDGCEGPCPVYRVVLFADGTILFQGQYHVRRAGLAKGSIKPAALMALLKEIDAAGFFELDNNYGVGEGGGGHCETVENGRPRVTLTVSSGGRARTVMHHHRCRGAVPDRITALEDKVDQAAGTAQWIK